jgi:tripartite-type tricarboxylate transporter receptor subunit TctC
LPRAVAVCPWLQAQDAYPTKPITMIAPFPPGGVADIVGRPLAASMEKTLKQPVLVVNRSGAGGAVGTTAAAKAAPDGYTILMSLSSISIFPVSDPINGRPAPYQLLGLRADRAGHRRSHGAGGRGRRAVQEHP